MQRRESFQYPEEMLGMWTIEILTVAREHRALAMKGVGSYLRMPMKGARRVCADQFEKPGFEPSHPAQAKQKDLDVGLEWPALEAPEAERVSSAITGILET
jgi:hypothetical protein